MHLFNVVEKIVSPSQNGLFLSRHSLDCSQCFTRQVCFYPFILTSIQWWQQYCICGYVGGHLPIRRGIHSFALNTKDTVSAAMYVFRILWRAFLKCSQKLISLGFITESTISMRAGAMLRHGPHQLHKRHTLMCCMIITFDFCSNISVRIINTQCVFVATPMMSTCC